MLRYIRFLVFGALVACYKPIQTKSIQPLASIITLDSLEKACEDLEREIDPNDTNLTGKVTSCGAYLAYKQYELQMRGNLMQLNAGYAAMIALSRGERGPRVAGMLGLSYDKIKRLPTCEEVQSSILVSMEEFEGRLPREEAKLEIVYQKISLLPEYNATKVRMRRAVRDTKMKVRSFRCKNNGNQEPSHQL